MRRIVLIGGALGALAITGVAIAATTPGSTNVYTASVKLTTKAAGTSAKPVPVGFTLNLTAKNATAGYRTAVLTDLKTKIYGLRADGKDFPTCSLDKIAAAKNDAKCPKGALVATGYITASVGVATDFTQAGGPCDPLLHVWNSGQGKLTFFFVDTATHQCLGGILKTGSTPPYPSTYKVQGKYLLVDVPVPTAISFPAPGVAGSLETEHLVWLKHTAKVKGKTVSTFSSVGCMGKKRPYAQSFTANLPTSTGAPGPSSTATVTGKATC